MHILASSPQGLWYTFGDFIILILIAALIVLTFEVWMLIDCIQNKYVPTYQKVWWIVGMFLLHPFVAIAYFFAARYHYNKLKSRK